MNLLPAQLHMSAVYAYFLPAGLGDGYMLCAEPFWKAPAPRLWYLIVVRM